MLVSHAREKLINVITYFVTNTKSCGKTKLFKLLYFLDFEHYSQTGRNVTGLKYFAWPMGPVPKELYNELDTPKEDMLLALDIRRKNESDILDIKPIKSFSNEYFSRREMKIIKNLCEKYEKSYANKMIEETHLENLPWHEIYEKQGKKQKEIPYELALTKSDYEQVLKSETEHNEFERNYK